MYRPDPVDANSHTLFLEHVWTVVSLPNGTYYWLQSYISQYSLGEWMSKSAREGTNPMSWEELQCRVELIREIETQRQDGWDEQVNRAYDTLWNVDILKAKQGRSGENFKEWRWERGEVTMELACEWPLKADPATPKTPQGFAHGLHPVAESSQSPRGGGESRLPGKATSRRSARRKKTRARAPLR